MDGSSSSVTVSTSLALVWPEPDALLEAGEDGPARRAQRGARAAAEVVRDFRRLEGETTKQLLTRLQALKRALLQQLAERLLAADQAPLEGLIRDVDRLIVDATTEILAATARPFRAAATLGDAAGDLPMRALQIQVVGGLPGAALGAALAPGERWVAEDPRKLGVAIAPAKGAGVRVSMSLRF